MSQLSERRPIIVGSEIADISLISHFPFVRDEFRLRSPVARITAALEEMKEARCRKIQNFSKNTQVCDQWRNTSESTFFELRDLTCSY